MPTRIPVIYPRYPRLYPRGSRGAAAQAARAGGGRATAGTGGIDQSSTGNVGGDIVKAINNQMQVNRQNAAANQLMNTQAPPRAQWVGGATPAQGVSTAGTLPQTGGQLELQARQQQDQAALNDQLQKAKVAAQLALVQQRTGRGTGGTVAGGNADAWKAYLSGGQPAGGTTTTRGGTRGAPKAPAYNAGSEDANTNLDADKFPNIQADFDARYGKGAYAKVAPQLANVQPDANGNYVIPNPKDPQNPLLTLPADQGNYWLSRLNAGNVRTGQPTLQTHIPTANPNSGQDPGTPANPYVPKTALEIRSLPNGKSFLYPDLGKDYPYPQGAAPGVIGTKSPPGQPAQGTTAAPAGGQKTSAVDTSGAGQVADQSGNLDFSGQPSDQVAANQPSSMPPTPQMPPLVPPVGQLGASRPDLNTGVGADQTAGAAPQDLGSQGLADAIARARLVDRYPGFGAPSAA